MYFILIGKSSLLIDRESCKCHNMSVVEIEQGFVKVVEFSVGVSVIRHWG